MFGWKRVDGTRRYRVVYVEVPRKNGKSTLAAGIALYLTFADRENGAQVFSAAADREQAAIVFDLAKHMVERNPQLVGRAEIFRRSMVVPFSASAYRVLSADAHTKHGVNAHGIVFDELHAQPNRNLVDVLKTSTGARRQPVEFYITTAGFDRHSICYEMHEYALKVRDGLIPDDAFLPVIYAASIEDDWTKKATWKKANPGYGVTIKPEYLAAECKRAQEIPGYENTFKRLHLNIWTEQSSRWLPMVRWNECESTHTRASMLGQECFAGLDLSSTSDLTAFVLDFPRLTLNASGSGVAEHVWLAWFWMPEENIAERVRRDRVPYDIWVREGWITPTPGNVIDYDRVRADINALLEQYVIKEIAIDRWNATQLSTQLSGDGFIVVPFGQGYASMSAPSRELEKLVIGGQLDHGHNPVLTWMASNVAVEQDAAGNLKPSKAKSGEKIDGIVAGVMGLARAMSIQAPAPSYQAFFV